MIEFLIKNASSISSMRNSIISGAIIDALAHSELIAARKAIERLAITDDKISQVWSAINHLQASREKFAVGHRSYPATLGGWMLHTRAASAERYTLVLMSFLYKSIGEHRNAMECLRESEEISFPLYPRTDPLLELANPKTWYGLYKGASDWVTGESTDITKAQYKKIKELISTAC